MDTSPFWPQHAPLFWSATSDAERFWLVPALVGDVGAAVQLDGGLAFIPAGAARYVLDSEVSAVVALDGAMAFRPGAHVPSFGGGRAYTLPMRWRIEGDLCAVVALDGAMTFRPARARPITPPRRVRLPSDLEGRVSLSGAPRFRDYVREVLVPEDEEVLALLARAVPLPDDDELLVLAGGCR